MRLTLYMPAAPRINRAASVKKASRELQKGSGRRLYPISLGVAIGILFLCRQHNPSCERPRKRGYGKIVSRISNRILAAPQASVGMHLEVVSTTRRVWPNLGRQMQKYRFLLYPPSTFVVSHVLVGAAHFPILIKTAMFLLPTALRRLSPSPFQKLGAPSHRANWRILLKTHAPEDSY